MRQLGPQGPDAGTLVRSDEARVDPPTRSLPAESPSSPSANLLERFELRPLQGRVNFRWTSGIDVIQTLCDCVRLLPFEVLCDRFRVQFAAGNAQPASRSLRQAEEIVGHRDGGLHRSSITRVILARNPLPTAPPRPTSRSYTARARAPRDRGRDRFAYTHRTATPNRSRYTC